MKDISYNDLSEAFWEHGITTQNFSSFEQNFLLHGLPLIKYKSLCVPSEGIYVEYFAETVDDGITSILTWIPNAIFGTLIPRQKTINLYRASDVYSEFESDKYSKFFIQDHAYHMRNKNIDLGDMLLGYSLFEMLGLELDGIKDE